MPETGSENPLRTPTLEAHPTISVALSICQFVNRWRMCTKSTMRLPVTGTTRRCARDVLHFEMRCHFDRNLRRYKAWPKVEAGSCGSADGEVFGCWSPQAFIRGLPRGSLVADLGCGQGLCDFSELRTCEHRLDGSRNNTLNANQSSDITLAALRLLMQQAMARICKRLNPCLCGSDLPKHICGN